MNEGLFGTLFTAVMLVLMALFGPPGLKKFVLTALGVLLAAVVVIGLLVLVT